MIYHIFDEDMNYLTTKSLTGVIKGDIVLIDDDGGVIKELQVKRITHKDETTCKLMVGQPTKK